MSDPRPSPLASPQVFAGLSVGVVSVSFAAILIRLADAPPLVIGAWRLGLATLILTPAALGLKRAELRSLARREWGLAICSGILLGIHFAAWITSLDYTTVASSVVLVATNPLFVGLASHFFLGERMGGLMWLGLLVAVAGSMIIGYGDFGLTGRALLGDGLALVGAAAGAGYFLIGRRLRQRLSLLAYIWPTYGTAAVFLILAALAAGDRLVGYTPHTYLMFLLLALVPQIMGHSMLNWSLRHLSPTLVAVATLAEPISSALLAFLVLQETPPPLALVGGAILLVGIYLSMRGARRQPSHA